MAHYVVTGAAGFIASKVTELLLSAGHQVTGLDNLNDAYDVRLKHWRLRQLRELDGFTFYPVDVSQATQLRACFAVLPAAAAVINLAARAGVRPSVENPGLYYETNTAGSLNLLEACRTHGIPKFVLASTSSLYGAHNPMPFTESADTNRPLSPYAASKKAAEALCYTYHYLHGLDVTVLRYFTVYGPAGRPDMSLFRFVQWISEGRPVVLYGDGQQRRDFTYVDDIARGTLAALQPAGYEIFNLGSDQPVVLVDAIRLVETLVGRKAEFDRRAAHPADVPATWADISQARQRLGWEPAVAFAQGVENLVRWYQANRDWASSIRTD